MIAPANTIDWHAFLARPQLPAPAAEVVDKIRNAHVLVTGAGGSIGSALSLQLAKLGPRQLLLLDASEQALYRLQIAFAEAGLPAQARLILGDVGNSALLDEVLAPQQLIFHCAAHKHVPLLEQQPLEAIANNALATLTLVESATLAGAARVVLLSTDKAAAPASILGATKRIAERIVLAHGGIALRLANVLGTEGSVSETFARQLSAGVPMTVTAQDAERYFMTRKEAVALLLSAALEAAPESLLAPQLPRQHRVVALAEFLTSELCPGRASQILFIGNRPGDKLREVFYSDEEEASPLHLCGVMQINSKTRLDFFSPRSLESLREAVRSRDLAMAVDCVVALVPGYSPSQAIQDQFKPFAVRQ